MIVDAGIPVYLDDARTAKAAFGHLPQQKTGGKTEQNAANQISKKGLTFMIKVLFMCHGSLCPAANSGLKWR